MKNIDLTPIIEAFIAIISAFISLLIIPKLKAYLAEKLSAEQLENLKKWVKVAVAAAEQLYGSKTGQKKKEYVLSFLLSKGLVFDVDEVTALIESEVYKLTQGSGYLVSPEDDSVLTGDNDNNCTEPPAPDEETESDEADEESSLFQKRNTCG